MKDNAMQIKHIKKTKQQGFIILMGMLALVLGAAVWFGTLGSVRSNTMAIQQNDIHINHLKRIKEKMLTYAVLHPEIYSDSVNVPGIGYFPCPDQNGDGAIDAPDSPCGTDALGTNELFTMGMVPFKIGTRNFSFIDSLSDNHLYWYAVDSRLVNSSARFATATSQRFSTINNELEPLVQIEAAVLAAAGIPDPGPIAPMTLDGKDQIVMVLFYAGPPLAGQTRPSNNPADYLEQPAIVAGLPLDFQSVGVNPDTFNDYVIPITRREWESAMLSRVSRDINPEDTIPDACDLLAPVQPADWFEECLYTGVNVPPFTDLPFTDNCPNTSVIADENITGQGWRAIICN